MYVIGIGVSTCVMTLVMIILMSDEFAYHEVTVHSQSCREIRPALNFFNWAGALKIFKWVLLAARVTALV